jgi:hypothetical protein
LESALRTAAAVGDYDAAQRHVSELQEILRTSGHEAKLMKAKVWLFEAAMQAGHFSVATPGFIGIRAKTSKAARLHLEATAMLAACYLRQKNLAKAEPLIAEVLKNRSIHSEARRKKFLQGVVSRFQEEGLLGALASHKLDDMDPDEIQQLAAELVRTKNEDEILFELGKALPPDSVAFLLKVDAAAKHSLTNKEIFYLPGKQQIMEKAELGRTTFRSFKRVLWRSLCDPKSDIYKAWYSGGLSLILDRKYFVMAITTALVNISIGIKALVVSAVALIMKFGLEVYCDRFRPDFMMEGRA